MAFMPRHPFINKSVAILRKNLEHPDYLMRENTIEAEAETSWTMRISGPAMYQYALHELLHKSGCRKRENSYCNALMAPEQHCKDMNMFRSIFPEGLRIFRHINLGNAISHKIFYPASSWEKETTEQFAFDDYDDVNNHLLKDGVPGFCGADAFALRAVARIRTWADNVDKND